MQRNRESLVGTVPLPRAQDIDMDDDLDSEPSSSDSGMLADDLMDNMHQMEQDRLVKEYRDIINADHVSSNDSSNSEDDEWGGIRYDRHSVCRDPRHQEGVVYADAENVADHVSSNDSSNSEDDEWGGIRYDRHSVCRDPRVQISGGRHQEGVVYADASSNGSGSGDSIHWTENPPTRTASQEEEEEVTKSIINDPEVVTNTLNNTNLVLSPRTIQSSASRKTLKKTQRDFENHVHFGNGSIVPPLESAEQALSGDEGLNWEENAVPAWDMQVSPMDKTFRSRLGGPLGTSVQHPPGLGSSSDEESDGADSLEHYSNYFESANCVGVVNADRSCNIDDQEDDVDDGELRRFLLLESAIFSVISPYMTSSPSGKGKSPQPIVFSRELIRSIGKTAVDFILPNASNDLTKRSVEGVYSVLRMFEGADIAGSYRLLMDLLKSVLEELVDADESMGNSRNPPVRGYNKAGLPKSLTAKSRKNRGVKSAQPAAATNEKETCINIDAEWTHPLISDLLRQNPSLRAYVKSRTDAEARAAGFEKPVDNPPLAPEVSGKIYVLSSSTSSSSSECSSSASSGASVCSASERDDLESDDVEDEIDPITKLMNTSVASTDVNTASPKRSPKRNNCFHVRNEVLRESTVDVGPAAAVAQHSPASTPPRNSPLRVINDAAESAANALSAGDYSDEDVLNEFQQRVARSPLINKMSTTTDHSLSQVDVTKTSPKLKAEARRRRKHSNVVHDDSSSAGNATEEEIRKEQHKNAPYDDSSDADEDHEAERLRRSRHRNLSYDDSTSAGNRSEEERRKQRHMNVPYDDSSSAGEATDEEARRVKHKNVPYDDSSTAGGGLEGSDESVDSEGLLATAALTTAVNDWDKSNEEEMIRRKYRTQETNASASKKNISDGERDFVAEDDDDYDFASAVVKYWDQLLGPAHVETPANENEVDSALRRASLVTMQSFNTNAATARPETPTTEGSLERSPEAIRQASFEEFRSMSESECNEYLYGSIEQSMQDPIVDEDLKMVQSDLQLWQELEERNNAREIAPEGVAKTGTQRDYATLRSEIFELANVLGVSPADVLLSKSFQPVDVPGIDRAAGNRPTTAGKSRQYQLPEEDFPDDFRDDALAGFLNGLNSSCAGLKISTSGKGTNLFGAGKKGKQKKTLKNGDKHEKTLSSKPSKKKKKKSVCPPSPSLLKPTTSFIKSAPAGPNGKKAKTSSRAAMKAAGDRGKRRVPGKDKNSSVSMKKEIVGPAPAGSVQFVSVKRKNKVEEPMPAPTQKETPPSPALFLQSPKGTRGNVVLPERPSSAPPKRMTRRVGQNLNDTDIVVVNNTPIYPQRNSVRPSSAPPGKVHPQRAMSPVLGSSRKGSRRGRAGQSLTTQSLSKPRKSTRSYVSSSLSAPTMSSIHRINETLTRTLDFMNVPRPKQPWDCFKGYKTASSGILKKK